tara:strand:+ start:356 stop:706 length:351 start_codon:yes stop_codon:yes gene_type:complete
MNTQREVFNKLFKEEKTELATQKIELKSLDVLKQKAKYLTAWVQTGTTIAKEYESLAKRRKSMLGRLQEAFQEYGSDIKDVEKALNTLGIKDTPKEVTAAKALLKEVARAANGLKL